MPLFQNGADAHIHSAYKSTVNLQTDSGLFTLQAADVPPTPMVVILDCTEAQLSRLVADTKTVLFRKEGLVLGGETVGFAPTCSIYRGTLRRATTRQPSTASCSNHIREVLEYSAPQESIYAVLSDRPREDELSRRTARETLDILKQTRQLFKWGGAAAAKRLCDLVGLGLGLTPAGDDFLVGVLAACDLVSHTSHEFYKALVREIGAGQNKTNAVSARYLTFACAGSYADPLRAAVQGMLDNAPSGELRGALVRAAKTGHSSGSDALSGVLWYLNLIEEGEYDGSLQ